MHFCKVSWHSHILRPPFPPLSLSISNSLSPSLSRSFFLSRLAYALSLKSMSILIHGPLRCSLHNILFHTHSLTNSFGSVTGHLQHGSIWPYSRLVFYSSPLLPPPSRGCPRASMVVTLSWRQILYGNEVGALTVYCLIILEVG